MKIDDKASISVRKIILMALIFAIILGATALASNVKINNVKIEFSNNHEITVITSKTKVSDILKENHIILENDETVTPKLDEELSNNKIVISKIGEEPVEIAKVEEININTEEILENYTNIIEKIVTVIEEIPFETITKDVSNGSNLTTNKIIQSGKNGEKKVTYKVTYKNDVEISRQEISSEIIKEPVNKIVQVQTKAITSRTSSRVSGTSGKSGMYKVTAYCACMQCCGKTNGITASGTKATANRTIAAPATFSFGSKVVINGVTYTVEDRGGAIQGNRIDVYMDTHSQALQWGVRYLYVEVLN